MNAAIVTGGGRGIGAATAVRLVARGFRVLIVARTQSELDATAERIRATHGRDVVQSVAGDVADATAVAEIHARAVEHFGDGLNVLVNNAGIASRAAVHEVTEVEWDRVLDVNLKGAFLCTRAVLPGFRARGRGRIINVASISATVGTARMAAYCASKWGLVGFTKALAEECRDVGVQAMAVLPGSVDTAMLEGSGYAPAMTADDVARTIEWLALDAPAAMNGSAVEMFS